MATPLHAPWKSGSDLTKWQQKGGSLLL